MTAARWLLFAHEVVAPRELAQTIDSMTGGLVVARPRVPAPLHVVHLVTEDEAREQLRANDWRPACGAAARLVAPMLQERGFALACVDCLGKAATA